MFLFFYGFQPNYFLILFLIFMKHSYLLMLPGYFNTTLEKCKVIYPDGTFDYITKEESSCVQVILL